MSMICLLAGRIAASNRAVAKALAQIVPVIQQPAAASESWEEHAVGAPEEAGNAKLADLHHVVWPDCPAWLVERLMSLCPKIQVNAYNSGTRQAKVICFQPVEQHWPMWLHAVTTLAY